MGRAGHRRANSPAKLARHLLHGAGTVGREHLAHSGATRERYLLDQRVGGELFADILKVGLGRDDVQDTVGHAGSLGKLVMRSVTQ